MNEMVKRAVFTFILLMAAVGTAWGGWFSFEPNILLLDGTSVARELKDLQEESAYRAKGDTAQADQFIRDAKVFIIQKEKYDNRVEYVKHKEEGNSVFVLVEDESGSKMWANMIGLACRDTNGGERPVNKADLDKGEFRPLSD